MNDIKKVQILLTQLEEAGYEMEVAAENESIQDLIRNEDYPETPEMEYAKIKFDGLTNQLDQLYAKLN